MNAIQKMIESAKHDVPCLGMIVKSDEEPIKTTFEQYEQPANSFTIGEMIEIENDNERQVEKVYRQLAKDIENILVNYIAPKPGLKHYFNENIMLEGQKLTKELIDEHLQKVYLANNNQIPDNYKLVTNTFTYKDLECDNGVFLSKFGNIEIIISRWIPNSSPIVLIFDPSAFEISVLMDLCDEEPQLHNNKQVKRIVYVVQLKRIKDSFCMSINTVG